MENPELDVVVDVAVIDVGRIVGIVRSLCFRQRRKRVGLTIEIGFSSIRAIGVRWLS